MDSRFRGAYLNTLFCLNYRYLLVMPILLRDHLSGPVDDPAKLINVSISHIRQLLCSLLTAATAPAVDHYDLIKIRQFRWPFRIYGLIRYKNRTGDMTAVVFILTPHIDYNMAIACIHHFLSLFLSYLLIACRFGDRCARNLRQLTFRRTRFITAG